MKRVFIIAIACMVLSSSTVAEKRRHPRVVPRGRPVLQQSTLKEAKFSISPIIGIGFGIGKKEMGTDYESNAQGDEIKDKNLYYSAGGGIKLGVGLEYRFLEEIGLGIDVGYSIGMTNDVDKWKYYSSSDSAWCTYTRTMKTSYILFSPSIRMEKKIMGLNPFCGFGLIFAMAPKSKSTYEDRWPNYTMDAEMELSHNLGVGSCGILGLKYPLMGGLGIMGEIRIDQLSLKAKHGKLTKYIVNGEDELPHMTTRDKECEYKDDDTDDTPSDSTKPNIEHTFITPANSVSIRVGIELSF